MNAKECSFHEEGGGVVVILYHQSLRAKRVRNRASRRKSVLTLIETDVMSAPVVRENTFVDHVEVLRSSVCVPSMGHVKIRVSI